MQRKAPTLSQALARIGCSHKAPRRSSKTLGKQAVYCGGEFVGNMNATEGWAFVKRRRRQTKRTRQPLVGLGVPSTPETARMANAAARRTKPAVRFGSDRVFITGAWSALTPSEKDAFDGDIEQFKASLLQAKRAGLVRLARADLVGMMNQRLVKGSHIKDGRNDFHFIEIDE